MTFSPRPPWPVHARAEPIALNARVPSLAGISEEDPRRTSEGVVRSPQAMDELIDPAYLQI